MLDQDLRAFVDATTRYFRDATGSPPALGTPFLEDRGLGALQLTYTGVIPISGRYQGTVCFSADFACLYSLLQILGEPPDNQELIRDAIGEVANNIAGNVQRHFGVDFLISVPQVLDDRTPLPAPAVDAKTFVVPLVWRGHHANLIASLGGAR